MGGMENSRPPCLRHGFVQVLNSPKLSAFSQGDHLGLNVLHPRRKFLRIEIGTAGLRLCLLCVLSIAAGLRVAQSQKSALQMDDIVKLLRSGSNEQALNLVTTRLKTYPKDCRLYSLQGMALNSLSRQPEALQAFDHALTLCPTNLAALEGAAQLRYLQRDKKAIPILERVIAIRPTNQPAHAMLASSLRSAGNCKAALPHFEASRSVFSGEAEWMEGEAACLATSGDYAAAQAQYRELQKTHPETAYVYALAWLESRTGNDREALATLEPLLKEGTYAPALSFGSYLAESLGDTPRAVDLLRRAILLVPDNAQNYVDFANIAFIHKSFPVGISMVDAGLKRLPDSAPLYLARGVLKAQITAQIPSAIQDFEHAHRLDPKLSLSVDALGIVKTQQYNDADSWELFERQAKLNPDDPVLQYLLAEQISQASENSEEALGRAIAAAKRATVLDPHYVPARDLLAKLYLRANEPKLAAEQAERALEDEPNDQEALYQKLLATRRMGDRAAVQELSKQFEAVRRANTERQKNLDRFRLEEVKGP